MTRNELIRCLICEYKHDRDELVKMSDDALVDLCIADMRNELGV